MKIYRHIIVALCAVTVILPPFGPSHIFAAEGTTQNTQQNIVETVKEAISDLVSAKDEKKQTETPIRFDTLKKAVSLAIDEAKNLRIKLIGLEDLSSDYEAWGIKKMESMKDMIETLDAFKKELGEIEKSEEITDGQIKELGERIKSWREKTYLPLSNEIQDYFLITEEYKTIEVAENRSSKIEVDIIKLDKRKKNTTNLKKLLENANTEIGVAKKINNEAKALFEDIYFPKKEVVATSTMLATPEEMSTTTTVITEETDAVTIQPKSVRDLVKDSSNKIRGSYKIFIEMSNLVRKLL
ncbi:MAG: hypothetical protein WC842_00560 [Candidatus Paceibacterota bacterium]|jgi:hypothetical protein